MNPEDVPLLAEQPARTRRWRGGASLIALLGAVMLFVSSYHLDSYSLGPGPARDVGKLIRVSASEGDASKGAFLLTTVSVSSDQLTILQALAAWIDPAVRVIEADLIRQPGFTDVGQDILNAQAMEESKIAAQVVAFRGAGKQVERRPGAYVLTVHPGGPAEDELKTGDVIVAFDGKPIRKPDELVDAVRARKVGERVRVSIERDGARKEVVLRTAPSVAVSDDEERPTSIGVSIGQAYRFPTRVHIETSNIGGPSGGLVFALAVADALSEEDLTRGHRIAATGALDMEGRVLEIGGVADKVVAAEAAGADVFMLPASEVDQARAAAGDGIQIVGVETFEDALEALRNLPDRHEAE